MMSDDEKPDNVVSLVLTTAPPVEDAVPDNLACPDCANQYWLINTERVISCSYCECVMGDPDE